MLEQIIIGLLIIVVLLLVYFNNNKGNSDIESLERLQLNTIQALEKRDTLDLKSIEDAKKSSEGEAKILKEQVKVLKELVEKEQKERGKAYGNVSKDIESLDRQFEKLENVAIQLHSSLKGDAKRGNWGEIQLRQILEHANMIKYVDFIEQYPIKTEDGKTQYPDVLVKMPSEKKLLIDSKAIGKLLKNYGQNDLSDEEKIDSEKRFAEDVADTMGKLSRKKYRDNLKDNNGNKLTPDFIIMFMPGEYHLQIAMLHKPELWEVSLDKKIILASPYILLALLKTVFYSWQQDERNSNTEKILKTTREVSDRITKLIEHIENVGDGLRKTVDSYESVVGSYNEMLLPSRRKLNSLDGSQETLLELETKAKENLTEFKKD
jgi:DNA recombination protein RmuC